MLVKLSQLHKSKFVKCFLIALVLVFSYEVSKPKAFVPLAWGVSLLAGIVVQEAAEMGIKWGTKKYVQKQADDWAAKMYNNGDNQFDFLKANPYLNKDGSVYISPTARDRAKIASFIAGALAGEALYDEVGASPSAVVGGPTISPMNIENPLDLQAYDFITTMYYGAPFLDGSYTAWSLDSISTGERFAWTWRYGGGGSITLRGIDAATFAYPDADFAINKNNPDAYTIALYKALQADEQQYDTQLKQFEGLIIPQTIERVYDVDINSTGAYGLPNKNEISNIPYVIENAMPVGTNEGQISWGDIENNYATPEEFITVVDGSTQKYVEQGILADTVYSETIINNYYTDINYPDKKEEVEDVPPVEDETPVVPDDNLPAEPVQDLDPSMWQVMKNTYNYLDDGIDASLVAMKGITDSAQGITSYLNQTMGWLPPEWRAVFTSAFVLGVFAHFLRR